VIQSCGSQLRVGGMGMPFGMDFGAVMTMAAARGADTALVAEALPAVEAAVLAGLAREEDGDDDC
jgi:hypothetical protein